MKTVVERAVLAILKGSRAALFGSLSANGEIFDGQFKDNERHGRGTLVMADGGVYTGEFEQGAMSGHGRFDGPLGSSYVGAFTNDMPNGPGSFFSADGQSYQGIFKMGELKGQVLVTISSGSQTVESWDNGE